jgi:hypothetical protein
MQQVVAKSGKFYVAGVTFSKGKWRGVITDETGTPVYGVISKNILFVWERLESKFNGK